MYFRPRFAYSMGDSKGSLELPRGRLETGESSASHGGFPASMPWTEPAWIVSTP